MNGWATLRLSAASFKAGSLLRLLAVADLLIPAARALSCLECNEIPGEVQRPCPGLKSIDFGRKIDACMVYVLETGRVIYQGPDRRDVCSKNQDFFAAIFERSFSSSGVAMCCQSDHCNRHVSHQIYNRLRASPESIFQEHLLPHHEAESSLRSSSRAPKAIFILIYLLAPALIHYYYHYYV